MPGIRSNRVVWTVLGPCVAFATVLIGAHWLMHASVSWEQWRPATCMPGACFCEAIRSGTVRQIANTWSSLAFVGVAFAVVAVARYDRAHRSVRANTASNASVMSQRTVYPVVFAFALLVVGVGSAFYHASLTFVGQFVDVFGMYLIGTFVLVYNLGRLRPTSDAAAAGTYAALNVVLATALYTVPELRRYAFAVVIVAALVVEYLLRRRSEVMADVRYLGAAIIALALGFVLWAFDIGRVRCQAQSLWQGHAAWHLLGAVACGCIYLFYRSEQRETH